MPLTTLCGSADKDSYDSLLVRESEPPFRWLNAIEGKLLSWEFREHVENKLYVNTVVNQSHIELCNSKIRVRSFTRASLFC